ncbi:MAG: TCR/Tet family MFS transporter [Hyphomicrobiaceae bacterium]|nr:TCR/Tet family MFS transporter [Hyphomicrobiaceae bacterium]
MNDPPGGDDATAAASPRGRGPRPGQAASLFVLFTVFLDSIAIGIMLPALPKLIESFVPGDAVLAAQIVGWFGAAWGLAQLFGSPFLGALSDRFGRRPVILISNLGLGLDYLLMAFAPTLWLLLFGRIVAGFTAATFATAYAYVTDVTPEPDRAAAYGRIGAVFGLGFIMGPAIGGVLAEIGPRVPFILAAVLSLINFIYGCLVLPESLAQENRMAFSWRRANPFASLVLLRRTPRLAWLSIVSLLDQLALVSIPAAFVLYTSHVFKWSELTTGLTFAAIGVGLAIVQGVLMGPTVKCLGNRRTLLLGYLFGIVGFAMYGLAPSSYVIWAAIPLLTLWGLVEGPTQSYMSREVSPNEYGQLQGAIAALHAIAETVGPLMFAGVYAYAIGSAAAWAPPGAPFLLAAVLHVVAITIAAVILRKEPWRG